MTRTLITAATLASLVTLPLPALAEDLASQIVGLWKYVSLTTKEVASGKETKLFGDNPKGYLLYMKGGRSMFVLVGDNRVKLTARSLHCGDSVRLSVSRRRPPVRAGGIIGAMIAHSSSLTSLG